MASVKKHNAYRGLIIWMLVLLALAALAYAGYMYTQKDLERAAQENETEVQRINDERSAQYLAAVNEREQQNTAAVQIDEQWPVPAAQGWDVVDLSALPVSAGSQISVTREEMLKGGLLVVNRWHAMPADLTDDMMVSINRYSRADNDKTTNLPTVNASISMMAPAVEALMNLYQDARDQGLDMDNIIIEGGYRTMEEQTLNWQQEEAKLNSRYSGDRLIEKVRETVAYPGTSDFQAGMSFKVYNYKSGDKDFSNTPLHETVQGRWLYDNSWRYGIVFRFPIQGFPYPDTVDKSYITGINLKNNKVYRYVGKANAIAMHAMDQCLEVYAQYLIDHPHIAVFEDGALRCEVYRLADPYSDAMVTIPNGAAGYTVSSDNLGGMVIAVNY